MLLIMDSSSVDSSKISSDRRLFQNWLFLGALPFLIVGLSIFFGLYEPRFWSLANQINVLRNTSFLMIISSGQMLVLIIGGFDLSVGAVVALTSVITATTLGSFSEMMPDQPLLSISLSLMITLFLCSLVGLVNGLSVSLLKVSPFIVTLGTMTITNGIALHLTSGVPIYGMPDVFSRGFGRLRWFNLPVSIYATVVILAIIWWIMNWTKLGRYIYAIGGNLHASRVSGIPTTKYLIITYTMCSLMASITGIFLTARMGSGEAMLGQSMMLDSIAAAVIGGVSLAGGVGRVGLVALGALFMSLIANGMNLIRIDSKIQTIVIGFVVIVAVALENIKRRDLN